MGPGPLDPVQREILRGVEDAQTVLDMIEHLLRMSFAHAEILDEIFSRPREQARYLGRCSDIEQELSCAGSELVTDEDRRVLGVRLRQSLSSREERALSLRAAAVAFDRRHGARVWDGFIRRADETGVYTIVPRRDCVYPTPLPDVRVIGSGARPAVSPRFAQPTRDLARLGSLRLTTAADVADGIQEVEFDLRAGRLLNSRVLVDSTRPVHLVSSHPTRTFPDDYAWDQKAVGASAYGSFFGVHPAGADHRARVLEHLQRAAEAGAAIAIYPELTMDADGCDLLEDLAARIRSLHRSALRNPPILVVAGSRHRGSPTVGDARNEMWLLLADGSRTRHCKFAPYESRSGGHHYVEAIGARPASLRVLACRDFNVAAVVCADAIADDLFPLLALAGVNLFLVPAMTDAINPFERVIGHVTGTTQAWCAVVNSPGEFDGSRVAHLVVDGPFRTGPGSFSGGPNTVTGHWTLDGASDPTFAAD